MSMRMLAKKINWWKWGLLSLVLISFWPLLQSGYFPMHDDLHPLRVVEMKNCFVDGQIPCRWSKDMGFGYGYPQFNFYPPLPYYTTGLFHWLGLGVLNSVKWGFVISFVGSAWGMYKLGKLFWGEKGAVISTLLYTFLPYRAVNVYARGAMGEAWAMMWFPWVFWNLEAYLRSREKKYVIGLALSLFGLMTSHLLSTMVLALFLVPWSLWRLYGSSERLQRLGGLALAGILGVGLAGFYVLPTMLEQDQVHIETLTMGYFSYYNHFVSIEQLMTNTHWGFGASEVWARDDLPFQIGLLHWSLAGLAILAGIWKMKRKEWLQVGLLLAGGFGYLFLMHARSGPIWQLPFMEFLHWLQFPWRMLAVSGLLLSLAGGSLVLLNKSVDYKHLLVIVVPLLILNVAYFQPKSVLQIDDEYKLSGEEWQKQITNSIHDYLPKGADAPPTKQAPGRPLIVEGEGKVGAFTKTTNKAYFDLQVESQSAIVLVPIFWYPGWQIEVGDEMVPVKVQDEIGAMLFEADQGTHPVEMTFKNTPLRLLANGVSVLSLIGLIWLLRIKRNNI